MELRRSVESLLASDERTEDPLLHAIGEAAESLLEDHQDRLIGTRIGHIASYPFSGTAA